MKYYNIIRNSFLMGMAALAVSACQEDLTIGTVDAPSVSGSGEPLIYVADTNGNTANANLEFRGDTGLDLFVNTTAPVAEDMTLYFSYDATVLDEYNRANRTAHVAVPESMVSFSNDGAATLKAGNSQSAPMTVGITSDGSLDSEVSYAVPVRISTGASRVSVASNSQTRIIFVRDLTGLQDCFKTVIDANGNEVDGIKIFSCMEVNDTNPLNNLRYTLKKSGKYMVDAVILFAGNINYNDETGRVYFNANPNVQHLLDNREKYLKPLQDRGMKVIMGLLCNHDRASVANLADETARYFALELKALCDAYKLDGMFYDCEYCSTGNYPGFVSNGAQAFSRLMYELWKLQPERWNIAYCYGPTSRAVAIDGVQPGEFCHYGLHDYGNSYDMSGNYPGMPKSNMGLYSQELNLGRGIASLGQLRSMRNNGYGSHMVFAMDPTKHSWRDDNVMSNCAQAFYDDEVVIDPHMYEKDW